MVESHYRKEYPMYKFLFLFLLSSVATAADRLAVSDSPFERITMSDNSDETEIKESLRRTAKYFSTENLTEFSNCFLSSKRKSIRGEAAFIFAEHKCHMSIEDMHIVEFDNKSAVVAVKYTMNSQEIVSAVALVKENDQWLIKQENIRKKQNAPCSGGSCGQAVIVEVGNFGGNCQNGRCGPRN